MKRHIKLKLALALVTVIPAVSQSVATADDAFEEAAKRRDYYAEITEATAKIKASPRNIDMVLDRAELYNTIGNYPKMIEDCNRAIAINADSASAYATRSRAYENSNQLEAALNDINHASKLDSKSFPISGRANLEKKMGKLNEAVADYTAQIKENPENGFAFGQRAKLYELQGKFGLREKDMAEAKRLGYVEGKDYFTSSK